MTTNSTTTCKNSEFGTCFTERSAPPDPTVRKPLLRPGVNRLRVPTQPDHRGPLADDAGRGWLFRYQVRVSNDDFQPPGAPG